MFFSSIKEINRLIKECQTFTIEKNWPSQNLRFSRKENLKKCTGFEEQKGARYIQENVYFVIIIFSYLFSTNLCPRFLLICFAQEIKSFNMKSFRNEVDSKSDTHRPKKFLFICFNESPLKKMKNAFYVTLKALFVFKIFKFLSRHFGHVGKRLD